MARGSPEAKTSLFKLAKARAKPQATPPKQKKRAGDDSDTEMCHLAANVPAIDKTGNWAADFRKECNREDFQRLITICWHHPDRISATLKYCKTLNDTEDEGATDTWDSKPHKLASLDREWLARFLGGLGIAATSLDDMTCNDADFCYTLLSVLAAHPLSTVIPVGIKDKKSLTHKFPTRRIQEVRRAPKVLANISAKGYNIMCGGPYKLVFTENRLHHVIHIDGDTAELPTHITITPDYNITSWWCDRAAAAELTPAKFALKDLFQSPAGPYKFMATLAVVAKLAADIFADAPLAEAKEEEAPVLSKTITKRAAAASAKAKETLAKHREMKNANSSLSLRA